MRRILYTAVTASILTFAFSGVALASDHGRHHRHHAHHASVHVRHFGVARTTNTATSPAAATTSATATIASFSNGVLTITLADGSTVSGKVTEATRIECPMSSEMVASMQGEQQDIGDDNGQDGNRGDGGPGPSNSPHGDFRGGPGPGDDQDGEEDNHGEGHCEHCTTAALVPGAVLGSAELRVSSGGAIWAEIQLAA